MSTSAASWAPCLCFLDIPTLLALRRVSHSLLLLVRLHLRNNLLLRIHDFVPAPESLLAALAFSNGFIVGSVAVDYILRSGDLAARAMDVLLPNDIRFTAFLFHLLSAQRGRLIYQQSLDPRSHANHRLRGVQAIAHVRTPFGVVCIYQSINEEPLMPLALSDLSVQLAYVNGTHFGTAYPKLLFRRRALVGEMTHASPATMTAYIGRQFTVRLFACQWPDRHHEERCASASFECPAQARTFTDGGSMRVTFNPLVDERLSPRVAWRLDVRPCGGSCFEPGQQLPTWQVMAAYL